MRTNEEGVSPVIATILMVAITVVLAAVLYVMVSRLIDIDPPINPIVTLDALGCDPTACRGRVTEAAPQEELGGFRVTILANGTVAVSPTRLEADTDITGGGLTLRYADLGGEGRLSGGDTFRLTGISPDVEYEVVFLWENTAVQTLVFST